MTFTINFPDWLILIWTILGAITSVVIVGYVLFMCFLLTVVARVFR